MIYGFMLPYIMILRYQRCLHAFRSTNNEIYSYRNDLVIAVTLVFVWLFYKLIYGLLIKRLNKNYKELKAIE